MSQPTRMLYLVLSPLMALILMASPAAAQTQEAEIKEARKKIAALAEQAERLKKEGATDKSAALLKEAIALERRVARAIEKDRPKKESSGQTEEIIKGLKAGAASLRALKRVEEAEKLERLAAELLQRESGEKRRSGADREREAAKKQLEVMRIAKQALLDAEREDLAKMLQRVIRSQELNLEGRRDKEANQIRESAPGQGQRVELLLFAGKLLREAGKKEQASAVTNLGEQWLVRFRANQKRNGEGERRERRREGDHKEREDGNREREVGAAQIELMQTALLALREGERRDSADVLQRAINARLVRLKELKGPEAEVALEREPKIGQTVEVLGLAAKLWREFGNEKKAASVAELAEKLSRKKDAK